jgi:hypothetical protein
MEHVLAEVAYVISVAIERQSNAPGGIDFTAYALLRNAQAKLGGAAAVVTEERAAASSGCAVCGGSGVRCCEFAADIEPSLGGVV